MNIYRVTTDDTEDWGLIAISLVDFPAVEKNFVKFKGERRTPVRMKADDDQHLITGIALLADTPIYRRSPELGEYYMVFEKETIRNLVERYASNGWQNIINLQHDESTYSADQCVMVESYFVNRDRGIVPAEFDDVPDGSWVVTFKVEDEDLWQQIKESHGEEGGLNGFSVEVVCDIEKMRAQRLAAKAKDETIADMEALAEALGWSEKKKSEFRVSRSDIKEILRGDEQVDITIDDETHRGQIKDLGRRDGADVCSVYWPEEDVWSVVDLDDIQAVKATGMPLAEWNWDAPGYKDIVEDEDVVVSDSREASDTNLKAAIEGRYFVNLFYDDESGEPCTGSRVVQVCAAGWHTGTNNKCFRAYQFSGATHTESPAWKMFLVKRVRSFRIMTEADKWTSVPAQYHMNDSQMSSILYQVDDHFIPE